MFGLKIIRLITSLEVFNFHGMTHPTYNDLSNSNWHQFASVNFGCDRRLNIALI